MHLSVTLCGLQLHGWVLVPKRFHFARIPLIADCGITSREEISQTDLLQRWRAVAAPHLSSLNSSEPPILPQMFVNLTVWLCFWFNAHLSIYLYIYMHVSLSTCTSVCHLHPQSIATIIYIPTVPCRTAGKVFLPVVKLYLICSNLHKPRLKPAQTGSNCFLWSYIDMAECIMGSKTGFRWLSATERSKPLYVINNGLIVGRQNSVYMMIRADWQGEKH